MHKPGHKQKYSNRPSVSDLPKREESKRKDIQNLTLRGEAGSMQKFLSEADNSDFIAGKWRGVDVHRRENLWKQWRESNKPEVRTWTEEQFKKSGNVFKDPEEKAWWHNKPRAFHQTGRKWRNLAFGEPISRRMTIQKGSVEDFLAELPHSAQKSSIWDQYKMPKLRKKYGEEVYMMPGNIEYEAHRIIQPGMVDEYLASSPLYGVEESKPKPLNIRK